MRESYFPVKVLIGAIIGIALLFIGISYTDTGSLKPVEENILKARVTENPQPIVPEPLPVEEVIPAITHVATPEHVRGIYVSAYSFMSATFRQRLDTLLQTTSINSIVVDIKDAPGIIMYEIGFDHPCIKPNIDQTELERILKHYHEKGIYIIARVAVFRDACFVKENTDLAVMNTSGQPWRDKGGNYWLAPHEQETREYIRDLSKAVYDRGFDEIQLDYIRYPSDGNMKTLRYEYVSTISASSTAMTKRRATIRDFMSYMRNELEGVPLSADVFGMVLTNKDDLTIGQHLDDFVPNIDYISPMIYPSHFPKNWNGIANPNSSPYQTIYDATQMGLIRMNAQVGTSTAQAMMRPWLQDFSLFGVIYRAPEVKAQIKALEDLGVQSFILWNASNRYTAGVL